MGVIEGFRARLDAGEVIVIDGGMGTELTRRGVPMPTPAWAAPSALEHKEDVRAAHEDFIRAGADVIITNTFMASPPSLAGVGLADRAQELYRRSVEAALEARENAADRPVLVAGAIFPGYVGSDFTTMEFPRESDGVEQLTRWVREEALALVAAGVDLIAFEMTPTVFWGRIALGVAAEIGVPVWLGTTFGQGEIIDGASYVFPIDPPGQLGEEVRQILDGTPADVMAVTVMHTEIDDIDGALDDLRPHWSGPVGVYPHHVEHITEAPGLRDLPIAPDEYVRRARGWVDRGVQIIGGCCAIGPEHIRALKEQLPTHVPQGARRQ